MPHHDVSDAHKLVDLILRNPEYVLLGLAMACGWIIWALRKVFPTHRGMEECKNQILCSLNNHKRFDDARFAKFEERQDSKHDAIERKVDKLTEFLMGKNGG